MDWLCQTNKLLHLHNAELTKLEIQNAQWPLNSTNQL